MKEAPYFRRIPPLRRLLWMHKVAGGSSSILKTVTGALLHITDALAKPAKKLEVTLEPIQSGSGDPSPENIRPITGHTGASVVRTGKNLLDVNSPYIANTLVATDGTYTVGNNSNFDVYRFPVKGNDKVWVHFTYAVSQLNMRAFLFNGNMEFTTLLANMTGSTEISEGYTISSDGYLIVCIRKNATDPYVAFDSSYSSYEAYKGTTIPITFPALGKNLFDKTIITSIASTLDYSVQLMPNTQYTMSTNHPRASSSAAFVFFRLDGESIGTATNGIFNGQSHTLTTGADGIAIVTARSLDSETLETFLTYDYQIELGSTATSYEPYTTTAYGCTLTNLGTGEWKLAVEWKNVIESSSTGWTVDIGNQRAYKNFSDMKTWANSGTPSAYIMSNYLPTISFTSGYTNKNAGIFVGGNSSNISIHINGVTTVESQMATALNTYLASNPLQICYYLDTPIEYTLTETQALTLLKGENNIRVDDSDNLVLDYLAKAGSTP